MPYVRDEPGAQKPLRRRSTNRYAPPSLPEPTGTLAPTCARPPLRVAKPNLYLFPSSSPRRTATSRSQRSYPLLSLSLAPPTLLCSRLPPLDDPKQVDDWTDSDEETKGSSREVKVGVSAPIGNPRSSRRKHCLDSSIRQIACGASTTLALTLDGKVWMWGSVRFLGSAKLWGGGRMFCVSCVCVLCGKATPGGRGRGHSFGVERGAETRRRG